VDARGVSPSLDLSMSCHFKRSREARARSRAAAAHGGVEAGQGTVPRVRRGSDL